jgi:hypothetical protein
MKATIYLTYKPVSNNIKQLLRDAQKLTFEHVIKADDIIEQPYLNPDKKVYGMFYQVDGNAATNSHFYARRDYGQAITSMSGVARFEKRDIPPQDILTGGPQVVLIADTDGGLSNMLHYQIFQNSWIIDYRIGGTWTFGINGGSIWLEPGADYLCELEIDRSTNSYRCKISGPEGKVVDTGWVVYAPIAALGTLDQAIWQIQQMDPDGDAHIPSWRNCAIGPYVRNGSPVNFGDGDPKPTWNSGFAKYTLGPIVATTNDYWSIMGPSTLSGFITEGTLYVHAVSAAGVFNGAYRVLNSNGATSPVIQPLGRELLFGSVPMIIRASNSASDARIDIAFTNAATNNVTANFVFVGAGAPANFGFPRPGVSALPTNSVLYTPSPPTTADVASATISTTGYYSVVAQSSFAAGGGIQGFFEVSAVRNDGAVASRFYMYIDQFGAVGLKPITIFPMYPGFQTID